MAPYDPARLNPARVGRKVRKKIARRGAARFAVAAVLAALGGVPAQAQMNNAFLSRSSPRPAYESPEAAKYNIKMGKLKARLYGYVQMEANDNINLSETNPEFDISIGPGLKLGFVYPINQNQTLQFNLGGSYRWYLNSPSLASFSVDPNTRLDYKLIVGDVQITISDQVSIQTDPTTLGQLSANPNNSLINFRRIHNTAGIFANWQPVAALSLSAGYDYVIDRSLSDSFTSLDRDEHVFSAGAYYTVSPKSIVGLTGNYSMTFYEEPTQNDGWQYTVGPVWNYKLSKFITLNTFVGYTVSGYSMTGSVTDSSEFAGWTYQANILHNINKRTNHRLQGSRFVGQGVGSNYTDIWSAQYAINYRLTERVTLNSSLSYEHLITSGPTSETSDRYLFYLGTGYQLGKNWSVGLGYAFTSKNSDLAGRSYDQNRVTLELGRQF